MAQILINITNKLWNIICLSSSPQLASPRVKTGIICLEADFLIAKTMFPQDLNDSFEPDCDPEPQHTREPGNPRTEQDALDPEVS